MVISAAGPSQAQVPSYFHAIHCDPQFAAEEDWQALENLVAAADTRGLLLTIQFNPAWSTVVGSDPARATQIESWVASGHEVGGHHHVLTHPAGWDGYSSEAADSTTAGYLGDMNDWLAALTSMLPSSLANRDGLEPRRRLPRWSGLPDRRLGFDSEPLRRGLRDRLSGTTLLCGGAPIIFGCLSVISKNWK